MDNNYKNNTELEQLINQLKDMTYTVAADKSITKSDLRTVLSFLSKVVLVIDQAYQDIISILVEIKYFSIEDLKRGKNQELMKQLDLVLSRSRYRKAEEICSRLHFLKDQYHDQIEPIVFHLERYSEWRKIYQLIEETEGQIITLIQHSVDELRQMLKRLNASTIGNLNSSAAQKTEELKSSIEELQSLRNQIMGLSGKEGFLELTENRDVLDKQISVLIDNRKIDLSHNKYSAEQLVGAMGPNAHVHDIAFQQWNQSSPDIDFDALTSELAKLRQAMREEAKSAEHDIAIGEVAHAETASTQKKWNDVLKHLKNAGKWALDVATKIGTTVVVEVIKTSLSSPS